MPARRLRKSSFLSGDQWAYTAGLIAIVIGAVIVFLLFPKKEQEQELLAKYLVEDEAQREAPAPSDTSAVDVRGARVARDDRNPGAGGDRR